MLITLVEFAIVLLLKRRSEIEQRTSKISGLEPEANKESETRRIATKDNILESTNVLSNDEVANVINATPSRMTFDIMKICPCTNASLTTRIDMAMFFCFTFGYLMFNFIYWNVCLSI